MLRRVLAAALVACLLPSPAFAWGFAAHKMIMRRALDLLPPEIKPFFIEHREEVIVRALDPDLWRSVGRAGDHNHILNFRAPRPGPFPFTAYPRRSCAALHRILRAQLAR